MHSLLNIPKFSKVLNVIIVNRSLSYSGAVLWNRLPLDICQSPSLDKFKSKLKNYDFNGRFR